MFSAYSWLAIDYTAPALFIKYGSTIYPYEATSVALVPTYVDYLYDLHIKPLAVDPLFAYGLRFKTAFNLEY